MELFEFTASQQAAIDQLPALLMAAGKGAGTPPVRIEQEAVLVPVALYELLLGLLDEHGLAGQVKLAVDADYARQEHELRATAGELGLDPEMVAGGPQTTTPPSAT
ncbi:MAG: hypothetical protein ABSG43_29000 [Solirubrobacteraceae bacterium]